MKIGVFDSGVGGLSVANAISASYPEHEVLFRNDTSHVPYGTRGIEEIYSFVRPILEGMVEEGCKLIVIACNTVTTNLINQLRSEISVPLVGIEPMVKPASELTKAGVIAVCATPRTLSSERYAELKSNYAQGIKVLEPDCSDWSYMIEHNEVDTVKIKYTVETVLANGADVIVLGCTHYHWIEELIVQIAGTRAVVLQPENAITSQIKRIIATL